MKCETYQPTLITLIDDDNWKTTYYLDRELSVEEQKHIVELATQFHGDDYVDAVYDYLMWDLKIIELNEPLEYLIDMTEPTIRIIEC